MRQISKFSRLLVKPVYHGSESVSFLGRKIWNMLPDDWKDIDNLYTFKNKVKKWKDENCPCRLCKIYINKGKKKLRKQKKAWDIQVVFLELWLLLTSIVLLPISSFYYLFNRLFLAYWWIHWIWSFLYLYRNQSINLLITISWLDSVWEVGVLRVWDSMGTSAIHGLLKFQ